MEERGLSRASRVDENLTLLLGPSIVSESHGRLSLAIAVVCEGKVVAVLIGKHFPHEWYVLDLAE